MNAETKIGIGRHANGLWRMSITPTTGGAIKVDVYIESKAGRTREDERPLAYAKAAAALKEAADAVAQKASDLA